MIYELGLLINTFYFMVVASINNYMIFFVNGKKNVLDLHINFHLLALYILTSIELYYTWNNI